MVVVVGPSQGRNLTQTEAFVEVTYQPLPRPMDITHQTMHPRIRPWNQRQPMIILRHSEEIHVGEDLGIRIYVAEEISSRMGFGEHRGEA